MHFDIGVAAAGLIVGFVVGLTGMGGGALMTPILVLIFNVQPLAAVSSDLVASVIMKPVGAGVHLRRGTVHKELVRWLVIGSVPSAFLGVIILKQMGHGDAVQNNIKIALGVALLVASASIVGKTVLQAMRPVTAPLHGPLEVKRLPTALIGVAGGLVVGMTSVGSGSLMIVMLLLLYPMLSASELVGTDLVQAIPLVASAALGHLLFGDFKLGLTASLLVGCLPGVYVGARVSARAPDRIIRPALVFVLLASALKLLNTPTTALGITLGVAAVVGLPALYWLSKPPTRVPVDA
ncbi:MAG TPA: sulfite exporter TauE/SafE family protein [Acidimicrobiales bacterium]|nr:sulfite exporter TauE/SafE family protein [Acidimicrobiales bacterium]